jgi:FkbM family methyltransferase
MLKTISKGLFSLLPAHSSLLYNIANRYVDRFNGDNNSDFISNGEERLLHSVLRGLSGGGVIFDVGANIGKWSLHCLQIAPQVELHLFEPSAFTYSRLLENTWPQNVYINNFGLGEKDETLTLHIFDDASGMNSLYARRGIGWHEVVKTEQIEIRTVDRYCDEHSIQKIDFMKVDVEGHDFSVLKGAEQMLSSHKISMIQFEYGGCNLDARVYLRDIWEFLQSRGYKLAKIYPNKLQYFDEYEQRLEVFKYSNWIALL